MNSKIVFIIAGICSKLAYVAAAISLVIGAIFFGFYAMHVHWGSELISGIGTVRYLDFEGGFWGIVSDDGENYDVGWLSGECAVDGLRVRFLVLTNSGYFTYHGWGVPVMVVNIEGIV